MFLASYNTLATDIFIEINQSLNQINQELDISS